jgi:hypothetical protein
MAHFGHAEAVATCLLLGEERTLLGSAPRSEFDLKRSWGNPSFDHLVSEREECRRQLKAERLSGSEIDHQLEFGRLHHR